MMMKIDRGLALAVLLATASTALASHDADGQRNRRGRDNSGVQSLPQLTCPGAEGTEAAGAAQAAMNRTLLPNLSPPDKEAAFNTVVQLAEAGATAEPNNPHFPYLAAQAHAGLGHTEPAIAAYKKAGQMCPELVGELYNEGMRRFQQNDTTSAMAMWQGVVDVDSARLDATFNLGVLYSQRGDHQRAGALFRRVAASEAADSAAAENRVIAMQGVANAGANLFGQNKYREAAELFSFVNARDANNRDAWYNHALALYKLETWPALVPVATKLVEIDPLNYNAQIILFNAYKGISEASKAQNDTATERRNRLQALSVLERADALPVQVDNVQFESGSAGSVVVKGVVTGSAAAAGAPVQIAFTLVDAQGPVGESTVSVAAPAKGATANFEVTVPVSRPATSWRYRLAR
jgi:tetratricopeptide (TPR) repeat protein